MRGDRDRLIDILEAIARISRYTSLGRSAFDGDELIQNWIVHHLEIIGEACTRISPELRAANAVVPWRGYIGMRNILVHQYFGIDLEPVWLAATGELEALRKVIEEILADLPAEEP